MPITFAAELLGAPSEDVKASSLCILFSPRPQSCSRLLGPEAVYGDPGMKLIKAKGDRNGGSGAGGSGGGGGEGGRGGGDGKRGKNGGKCSASSETHDRCAHVIVPEG